VGNANYATMAKFQFEKYGSQLLHARSETRHNQEKFAI